MVSKVKALDALKQIEIGRVVYNDITEAMATLKEFINQPVHLKYEDIIHRLETFKDSQVIYGGEWGELQDAIDLIQSLAKENNDLRECLDHNDKAYIATIDIQYENAINAINSRDDKLNKIKDVVNIHYHHAKTQYVKNVFYEIAQILDE